MGHATLFHTHKHQTDNTTILVTILISQRDKPNIVPMLVLAWHNYYCLKINTAKQHKNMANSALTVHRTYNIPSILINTKHHTDKKRKTKHAC